MDENKFKNDIDYPKVSAIDNEDDLFEMDDYFEDVAHKPIFKVTDFLSLIGQTSFYGFAVNKLTEVFTKVSAADFEQFDLLKSRLSSYNLDGSRDIYFNPNGMFNLENVNRCSCFYADFDIKDEEGNDVNKYYIDSEMHQLGYEKVMLERQIKSILKPTAIIETRNGLQAYWALNELIPVTVWKPIHAFISLELFKGLADPLILDGPSMRLPGFNWVKKFKGDYKPYPVKMIYEGMKYNLDEILSKLSAKGFNVPSETSGTETEFIDFSFVEGKSGNTQFKDNLEIDLEKNIDPLLDLINPPILITVPLFTPNQKSIPKINNLNEIQVKRSNQDIIHEINESIDLCFEAGIKSHRKNFRCPFHDDKHPSATILHRETDFFHCAGCGLDLSPIQFLAKKYHKDEKDIINEHRIKLGIENSKSKWQLNQELKLIKNIDLLSDLTLYPNIAKQSKATLILIKELNQLALSHLLYESMSKLNDNTFFGSVRVIRDACNLKSHSKIGDRIKKLSLMGFVHIVLHELELKTHVYADMIQWRKEKNKVKAKTAKNKKGDLSLPSYYSIPEYTLDLLAQIDQRVGKLKGKVSNPVISKSGILETFGTEIYAKLYPQFKNHRLSENELNTIVKLTEILHEAHLKEGYCPESKLVAWMKKSGFSEIQLRRFIPSIVQFYGFSRVKANKEMIQRFGIESKGYPILILP